MLWFYLFLILVVVGTIYVLAVDYPVILAILILSITVIIILRHNSKSKVREEALVHINRAVKFIEEAYDMAIKHPEIEPSSIFMDLEYHPASSCKFLVCLFTGTQVTPEENEIIPRIKNTLKNYSDFSCEDDWQVAVNCYYLCVERSSLVPVPNLHNSAELNLEALHTFETNFENEVWDTVKKRHPSWNVTTGESRSYKIEFD